MINIRRTLRVYRVPTLPLLTILPITVAVCSTPAVERPSSDLIADRTAIERVYHANRRGASDAFEEAVPGPAIEQKVALALKKEQLLNDRYGIHITPQQITNEWRRIKRRTRAPAMLVQIEAALGHNRNRIAQALVKPLLVDRALRRHFTYDPALHQAQRQQADALRATLLDLKENSRTSTVRITEAAAAHDIAPQRVTWALTDSENAESGPLMLPHQNAGAGSRDYTVDATITVPPMESAGDAGTDEEAGSAPVLPAALRQVLVPVLRKPGDISPVVESPDAFTLYVAEKRSEEVLSATILRVRKQTYREWLALPHPASTTEP